MEAVCALFNAYRNDWGPDATPNIYQLRETAMQRTTTFLTDRLPNPCPQAAPISPNVFSDGSVDHPKFPRWAHPTAALVLPAGEEVVVPDIPGTKLRRHTSDGVTSIHISFTDFRATSCRAEAVGMLVAALQPFATHVCLDGMSAIQSMASADRFRASWFPRPQALVGNGDIWQLFFKAVEARGAHTFLASWGKGHSTAAEIARGLTTADRAAGNHKAHTACDQARQLVDVASAALTALYMQRRAEYLQMVIKIHAHLVAVATFVREHREGQERTARAAAWARGVAQTKVLVKVPLHFAAIADAGPIDLLPPPTVVPTFPHFATLYRHVHAFLSTLFIQYPLPVGHNGISWLASGFVSPEGWGYFGSAMG